MAKIIGLTGGIGSGKSTIARIFEKKGIPVYFADEEAKKILLFPEIVKKIKEEFGNDVYHDNLLNKDLLANIVFNNPEKLKKLNAIVHPAVKKHFDEWVFQNKSKPFVLKEAAILFESGSDKDCDFVITVTAPLESRIERVIKRDNVTREKVIARIKNQLTDEEKIAKSDFVINNINLSEADESVNKILKSLNN